MNTASEPLNTAECAHCGLPVARGDFNPRARHQFCCSGCRAVHSALVENGFERYYELREAERAESAARAQALAIPAQVSNRGFEHLDGEHFQQPHVRATADGLNTVEMRIDGMRCGACVWLLESTPRIVTGLVECRVDSARAIAMLRWDPREVALSSVAQRFDTLGYQLIPLGDIEGVKRERAADRAWFVRIGVAGAIASNAMAVAFALYGGIISEMPTSFRLYFQWYSVGLAVAALFVPGRVFLTNAIAALRMRTSHMDIPVAFGLMAAVGAGIVATVRGTGSIYCESAAMLVFLLLVGRFVQFRSQRQAREQVELLLAILPAVARRVQRSADRQTEQLVEVLSESLNPDDVVEIAAGESAPADGRLIGVAVHFDLSHLTGESRPVRIEVGGPIYAGSRPINAPARCVVTVAGVHTRAARLLELVREASTRRAPVVELANRIAGVFLAAVMVFAVTTIAWWWPRIGAEQAIERAIAVLVVTCPCALGLATPLAVVAGIGRGARRGVLIKGGDVLERASQAGTLVLDKTGTVTEGATRVVARSGNAMAITLAASVESHSVHPLARAILDAAHDASDVAAQEAFDRCEVKEGTLARLMAHDVRETPGRGIEGRVGKHFVRVGSVRFMSEHAALIPDGLREDAHRFAQGGLAPIMIAVDARVEAVLGIGDPIRREAHAIIARLRRAKWRVMLASGDDPLVAASVARSVGIDRRDAFGALTPEDKLAFVRRTDLARPVVMVGDGINDLAALAAADIGVSLRNGAQASHHVADVCLAAPGMRPLERFIEGSRTTMRAIRINLAISVAYNALGGALAFAGLVNPLVAALLMPLSGLTVLVLALRLPSFDPKSLHGENA